MKKEIQREIEIFDLERRIKNIKQSIKIAFYCAVVLGAIMLSLLIY